MKKTTILVTGLMCACGMVSADEAPDPSYESDETNVPGSPDAADDGVAAVKDSLLRRTVMTVDGDEIGVVRDVGYSAAYGAPIAVVDLDAFIGVGEKLIAIPLSQLQTADASSDSVMTTMTRDAVEAEEAFDESDFTPIE